ncbi:hypothetical protein ACFLY0_02275 [Patescibacteria group bacterium]
MFKCKFIIIFLITFFSWTQFVYASETNGTIDASYKYAWGENTGWINMKPDNGDAITITDSAITGYAWSSVGGWINFSPTNGGVTNTSEGVLGGNAWSSQKGWISMTGITIGSDGKFTGTAGTLGSNAGRITFSCDNCDVRTDWRPESSRTTTTTTGGGGPPSSGDGGDGSGLNVELINLNTIPHIDSINITWDTNIPTKGVLYYGTTTDLNLGEYAEDSYTETHSLTIPNLELDTLYYFKITTLSESGTGYTTEIFSAKTGVVVDNTPPDNVANFFAEAVDDEIILSWTNPSDPDFDSVLIRRSNTNYPTSPTDGTHVVSTVDTLFTDINIDVNTDYYYTAFAMDYSGNYSSGAIVFIEGLVEPEVVVEPPIIEEPPEVDDGDVDVSVPGGFGIGSYIEEAALEVVDLVTDFLEPEDPTIEISDFYVVQDGNVKKFSITNHVYIAPEGSVVLSVDKENIPENIETISVTISPEGFDEEYSYLFQEEDGNVFRAQVQPIFLDDQVYEIYIDVFYDNKEQETLQAALVVGSSIKEAIVELMTNEEVITTTSNTIALSTGAASSVVAFGNFQALLSRILMFLSGLFRRRKQAPWGVVYDSETKQPLDPAYVVLKDMNGDVIDESITDMDGRYGFVVKPGNYLIDVNKTNYLFPSEKLKMSSADILYDRLYHGGMVESISGQPIAFNIPMDPVAFDWNEFAKKNVYKFRFNAKKEIIRIILFNSIFFAGFMWAALAAITEPGVVSYTLLGGYAALGIVQYLIRTRYRMSRVVDTKTKSIVPFAIVKAYEPKNNILMKKVVADEDGRFLMLLPASDMYYFTIEEHQPDGSYALIHKTQAQKVKKGFVVKDINIA